MAENIVVVMNKDDLQPLANDIKTLNGLSQSDLVTLNEMEKAIEDANDAVDSQENLIAQISAALEGKAAGGGGSAEPVLQEKTVSPSTSQQNVTPDSGYDGLSKVTVNAMPAGSVANPSISVNSSGLITATAAVDAGYVDGTDKTGTKQLTAQAAKTITPTKSSQTAVASGRYTTGAVTVAAIPSTYQDVTGVDAVAVDVVEGKKIVSSTGATVTGTNPYAKAATDTEVNSQATKLAELKTILQGKASGGGSGGSVETCTVTINCFQNLSGYGFTIFEQGEIVPRGEIEGGGLGVNQLTVNNVVCGSLVYCYNSHDLNGFTLTGGIERLPTGAGMTGGYLFKAPTVSGATGVITIYDDD